MLHNSNFSLFFFSSLCECGVHATQESRNNIMSKWQVPSAEVCACKDKWYVINMGRGTYTGTNHMATGNTWGNPIHPDFMQDNSGSALKFFAVNDRWYTVKYDASCDSLLYHCTSHMNKLDNPYKRYFHTGLMEHIPGWNGSQVGSAGGCLSLLTPT